ncbi:trna methyltransferase [Holotrichia oblita]|uniref:Trna methyltransferase n=1 Tax=Holotrichia oblita TaxID=644536 RepID=A0ACB9T644_HOLOL|nr:trna methyltransferase [Holotrichia oblita]
MSKLQSLLKPHSIVQGMTVLDRTQFDKVVSVPCINVIENKLTDNLPHLKKYLLKLPKLKPIQTIDEQTLIILNPDLISTWNDIEVNVKEHLNKFNINEGNFVFRNQTLTYDNYVADDILKAILPTDQDGMSSFTKIGHIVHVNLREHLLPYKSLIGQVLFDKVPNCETVVNKVNIIDNTYRNFQMEVLCGKEDLKTKIKENGCQFEFDFGTVYWNSRLSTEHERIVKLIDKNDVLFDVFAGVGPFSIPIAKKKGVVYANDLNPESFHWLKHNATLNKINDRHLHVFNKDGKDFILDDIKINLQKHLDQNIHIVMNLPALATDFLKYFIGLYDETELETAFIKNPPTVYVYCFAKGEDYIKITEDLISSSLNRDMKDRIDMFKVRTSVMGKNKHQKVKNIFKVAGAKSLKPKSKAKVVKGQLKQITLKNKAKITEVDQQLVSVQDKIRQAEKKTEKTTDSSKSATPPESMTEEQYKEIETKHITTLQNLNEMQL